MSARDLATFGRLYLAKGQASGRQVLPESWVERIASDHTKTGRDDLRWAHGYLWWLPGPGTGLPKGTYWAWGLGNQALFVVPSWQTVIVHQSDTGEFLKRFLPLIASGKSGEAAIMELIRRVPRTSQPQQRILCRASLHDTGRVRPADGTDRCRQALAAWLQTDQILNTHSIATPRPRTSFRRGTTSQ